jgi:hypothetical protein
MHAFGRTTANRWTGRVGGVTKVQAEHSSCFVEDRITCGNDLSLNAIVVIVPPRAMRGLPMLGNGDCATSAVQKAVKKLKREKYP